MKKTLTTDVSTEKIIDNESNAEQKRNEILQSAHIPEDEWDSCYISDTGMIFTPEKNENNEIVLTGEERYNQWVEAQNQPPEEPDGMPEPVDFETAQKMKQEKNKITLASFLSEHPILWTDGKYYGVTLDDQQEMSLNLMQYQLAVQAGQPAKLEWHSVKSACTEWRLEDYTALSLAVSEFVYPYLRYQENIKEQIFAATTNEELEAIVIDYESISVKA